MNKKQLKKNYELLEQRLLKEKYLNNELTSKNNKLVLEIQNLINLKKQQEIYKIQNLLQEIG